MADRTSFAKCLDEQLREKSISQTDLANAIGVSKSIVSLWLKGKSYPRIDVIQKIADHFNVSTDYMVSGNESLKNLKAARQDEIMYFVTKEEAELIEGYQHLNDENKARLNEQLRMLQLMQMIDERRP